MTSQRRQQNGFRSRLCLPTVTAVSQLPSFVTRGVPGWHGYGYSTIPTAGSMLSKPKRMVRHTTKTGTVHSTERAAM